MLPSLSSGFPISTLSVPASNILSLKQMIKPSHLIVNLIKTLQIARNSPEVMTLK